MTIPNLYLRDHGGDGPPLLLLHGAGRSHADWDPLVPQLLPRHRVVAVDLPAHGRSPEPAVWTFDAVLDAIEATLGDAGLPDAIPVGHSLGGMVAALYAVRHPGVTPAAVNLDGFWWDDSPGVRQDTARFRELLRSNAGARMPADYIAQQGAYAAGFGIPADRAEATARAAARELPDGRWQTLPERERALEMFDALDGVDLFAAFRAASCPLLLVRAEREQPPTPGMEWFEAMVVEHGQWLTRELAALPDLVTVRGIDATHAMLLEEPAEVASLVGDFLAGL